jgi:hypothetical protein
MMGNNDSPFSIDMCNFFIEEATFSIFNDDLRSKVSVESFSGRLSKKTGIAQIDAMTAIGIVAERGDHLTRKPAKENFRWT